MDTYSEFDQLMSQLEDWYSDSVRAQSFDSTGGHDSEERLPRAHKYPGPPWRQLWRQAAGNLVAQAAITRALEEEIYGLDHGPSQSGPASGLHRGTQEWGRAVAAADGSLRAVSRRFGVSHTEVRRLRFQYGREA